MIIDAQIRSLQNFADKFSLTVKYYQYEDKRKKTKFLLTKEGISLSQPLTYEEVNTFLLGVLRCKENKI